MSWSPRTSRIVVGVWAVTAIVADVFLSANAIRGDTWTEVLRAWGRAQSFVPYALAAVLGHMTSWWVGESPIPLEFGARFAIVIGVGSVLALVSWMGRRASGENLIPPWAAAATGLCMGGVFWV